MEGNFWVNLNVSASIPFGRAINPISGTNWEGTGVAPDFVVSSDKALDAAHAEALRKILARTASDDDRSGLEWRIQTLEDKLNPAVVDVASLAQYAGLYGPRTVKYEEGELYYRRGQNPWARMIPMSTTLFRFDEFDYFRLEVALDSQGRPMKLIGHYDNGQVDESARDEQQVTR